jgi:Ulp1 family protease
LEIFEEEFPTKRRLSQKEEWLKLNDLLREQRQSMKMWMDDIDANTIHASSFLFIPIHQKNHWSLLVVDLLRRTMVHLDSMWPPGSTAIADRVVSNTYFLCSHYHAYTC